MTTRKLRLMPAAWLASAALALADGGAVQLSQIIGPHRVTVLTSPTPLRVGRCDVSVVVSDAERGDDVRSARILLSLVPLDGSAAPTTHAATTDASPTGLFQMATFDAPRPGIWTLTVDIDGPAGLAHVATDLQIAPPIPRWSAFLGWILLPLGPIALHLIRTGRGRSAPRSAG
jgi:hypothetical protein